MKRAPRKSDQPRFRIQRVGRVAAAKPMRLSDAEKLEFVLSHKFPDVELCDLEEIETATKQGASLEEAIESYVEDVQVPADECEQYEADLKAAHEFKEEVSSGGRLNALFQEIQE